MTGIRTPFSIPDKVLEAVDHVRQWFPEVCLVVYNDMGRWQFMGEDFEKVVFGDFAIDIGLLETASAEAYDDKGYPCVYQPYSTEEYL